MPSAAATDVLARFRIVFRAAREHNAQIERACGVGGPALRALAILVASPGMRVTELARALLVRQPTASQIVDELVAAGLVLRRRGAEDQRAVELFPTARSKRTLQAAPGSPLGVLPAALAEMPADELARLAAALDDLIARITNRDDSARYRPIAES